MAGCSEPNHLKIMVKIRNNYNKFKKLNKKTKDNAKLMSNRCFDSTYIKIGTLN